MKSSIYLFAAALLLMVSSCSKDNEVSPAELNSSKFLEISLIIDDLDETKTITGDAVLEKWSKEQTELNDTPINFESVTVERIEDKSGNLIENQVFVKSKSVDGSVSIGAIFTQDKEGNYRRGKECTCTGTCGQRCDLSVLGGNCRCSSCFPSNSRNCTKTEKIIVNEQ
jgi:hypothetical protein